MVVGLCGCRLPRKSCCSQPREIESTFAYRSEKYLSRVLPCNSVSGNSCAPCRAQFIIYDLCVGQNGPAPPGLFPSLRTMSPFARSLLYCACLSGSSPVDFTSNVLLLFHPPALRAGQRYGRVWAVSLVRSAQPGVLRQHVGGRGEHVSEGTTEGVNTKNQSSAVGFFFEGAESMKFLTERGWCVYVVHPRVFCQRRPK